MRTDPNFTVLPRAGGGGSVLKTTPTIPSHVLRPHRALGAHSQRVRREGHGLVPLLRCAAVPTSWARTSRLVAQWADSDVPIPGI